MGGETSEYCLKEKSAETGSSFTSSIVSSSLDFDALAPFLRAVLVTDGTLTELLSAYFAEKVSVELVYQKEQDLLVDNEHLGLPAGAAVLKRSVALKGTNTKKCYCLAESLINIEGLDRVDPCIKTELMKALCGIGEILKQRKVQTYRQVLDMFTENSSSAMLCGSAGNIVARKYLIWSGCKPVVLVKERYPECMFVPDGKKS